MKESNVQTLFGKKNDKLGVFELKLCKGTSIPFDSVAEHQIRALCHVESDGLYHKISDASYEKKPFDCFYLKEVPAYVVPVFYIPRKKKTAYFIRIMDFITMRDTAYRKSFTEEMAKEFAESSIEL